MRNSDMMGLAYYDDLDGFMSPDMIRDSFIASGAGAGAILIATWLTPKLPAPKDWDEKNQHRLRAGVATVAGMLLGRAAWNYNRDVAMAIMGGVAGLGLAQLIDSFFEVNLLGGTPLGALPEDIELSAGDEALLEAYDHDQMSALRGLEATGVTSAPPAFAGFADPTVTPEALMGAIVQTETLGYNPYMA